MATWYQETACGPAYSCGSTTILFAFGVAPQWVTPAGNLITIVQPGRFGPWATPAQQREYTRRFHAGVTVY